MAAHVLDATRLPAERIPYQETALSVGLAHDDLIASGY